MNKDNFKRAFSLIELSIVIIIIGLLVAGITQSSILIYKMRLSGARSLTNSSPVHSISDLALWLETTSEASFDENATEDGTEINSSDSFTWHDINPLNTLKNTASSTTGATYKEECLNGLPCLRFDGSSQFFTTTQDLGTADKLTIFVVFSADSMGDGYRNFVTTVGGWIIDDLSFAYGLNTDTSANYYNSTSHSGLSPVIGQTLTTSRPYITQMIDNGTNVRHFVSGTSETSTTIDFGVKNLSTLAIGAFYDSANASEFFDGDIGEIIIFTKALSTRERLAVEEYLSKKWKIDL